MTQIDDSGTIHSRSGHAVQDKRGIPARYILLAVVAVFVVTSVLFTAFLLARYAEVERAKSELMGLSVANAAAGILDQHLTGMQTTLQTLATSPLLRSGNFSAFYEQAQQVKALENAEIGLRAANGERVLTTRLPWGARIPEIPLPIEFRSDQLSTRISNVYRGAITGKPQIAIITPVIVEDEVRYYLEISTETDRLLKVVQDAASPDWLVAVGDRQGIYVLRTENHEEFSGKPTVPAFVAKAQGTQGTFVGESAFGETVQVGYKRSPISGWLIAASIKQTLLEEPLSNALYALAGFGILILVVSSVIALWLWNFVARPLHRLARASSRIGTADADFAVKTSLREFIDLRDALSTASEEVRLNKVLLETRVQERTRELRQTNEELQAQIEARETAEGQLRQIQKIEAIGQLTGGIAHDFNNMLSIILSSLKLFEKRHARGHTNAMEFIESARDGATRAANLTKRLLAFSRQQPLSPSVIQINQVVTGMSELLQRTLAGAISIETVLAAGLWKTYADASQVENAILNLAVNARDAMAEGGKLTIETANCFLDEDYVRTHASVSAGQYVMLAVTDTGAGMPPEVLERVFDPFFTTKGPGMGTGLGLSQVYGFVKQSNGHIKIYSEPGEGTSVKIYLPRHTGDEVKSEIRITKLDPDLNGSPERVILVVEDEDNLRHITVSLLEELGYTVVEAEGPLNALEIIKEREDLSLLFTDVVMPEMSGRKLAEKAAAIRPELPVLFTTGFTRNAIVHNGVLDSGVNFLPKPFSMEQLAAKIRDALTE
jgi:signal transduction histidine kinase/CheY-like chemotaxis protein